MARCDFCGAEIENISDTICQYCGNPLDGKGSHEDNFGYGNADNQYRPNVNTDYNNAYRNPYQNPNQSNYSNPYQTQNFGGYRNPYANRQFYAEDTARSKLSSAKVFAILGVIFSHLFIFSVLAIKYAGDAAKLCPANKEIQDSAKSIKRLGKIGITVGGIIILLYIASFGITIAGGVH